MAEIKLKIASVVIGSGEGGGSGVAPYYADLPDKPSINGETLSGDMTSEDLGLASESQAVPSGGTTGQVLAKKSNEDNDVQWVNQESGGQVTTDYADLENKPKINNVTLSGNKTAAQLGLQPELVSGTNIKTINNQSIVGSGNITIEGGGTDDYADLDNKPQINSVALSGNKSASDLGLATTEQGAKADNAIPMPIGTDGQILEKDSKETSGVKWVNKPSDGDSAYQIAVDNGFVGSVDQWLASLKANIGAFKFIIPTDTTAEAALTTIGSTYANAIGGISPLQSTLSTILLMNDSNNTKTMMIATQDDGSSGFEFIYAGDLQSAMSSNVVTTKDLNERTTLLETKLGERYIRVNGVLYVSASAIKGSVQVNDTFTPDCFGYNSGKNIYKFSIKKGELVNLYNVNQGSVGLDPGLSYIAVNKQGIVIAIESFNTVNLLYDATEDADIYVAGMSINPPYIEISNYTSSSIQFECSEQGYINTNGVFVSHNAYWSSGYIPIRSNDVLYDILFDHYSYNNIAICVYSSQSVDGFLHAFINSETSTARITGRLDLSQYKEAKYLRISTAVYTRAFLNFDYNHVNIEESGGGASYTAGNGIDIDDSEIKAKVDGTTIGFNQDGELEVVSGGDSQQAQIDSINATYKGVRLESGWVVSKANSYLTGISVGDTYNESSTPQYSSARSVGKYIIKNKLSSVTIQGLNPQGQPWIVTNASGIVLAVGDSNLPEQTINLGALNSPSYIYYNTLTGYTSSIIIDEYYIGLSDAAGSVLPVDYLGNEIVMFKKGICIGDSLTDGAFNTNNSAIVIRDYSYPSCLSKLTGIDITNAGHSGLTASEWYNQHSNDDLSGHDFAIIALGVNDVLKQTGGWNTTSDTALGNIITKLKTENNNIKIFVCTPFAAFSYGGTGFDNCSASIKSYISALNDSNVVVLDTHSIGHTKDLVQYNAGHFTALGYLRLAEDIRNYISWYIHTHMSDFRNVQFIGTTYTPFR